MTSPPAEIDVTEELVRSLLIEQHPDLADRALVLLDAGWDNTIWRLGDDLLARLPRRIVAAALTVNEQRWLPEIGHRLPLPVPVPVRIGHPSAQYPWPWSVVPWFDGTPGDRAAVTDPDGAAVALGQFLRCLHHDAPSDAPHNSYRGVPLADRTPTFDDRIVALADEIDVDCTDGSRTVWETALGAEPWTGPRRWIHGDLHPANLLIGGGRPVAVLDFGDMCAGDPATDLASAWLLLPVPALEAFRAAYGDVDVDLERRSRGWAVLFALMLLEIGIAGARGLPGGRPTYESIGRSTLARLLEGLQ